MAPAGNKTGFRFTVDSDWAGLHSVTSETRSRIGIAIFYNGMPICWKSTLTSSTQLSSGQAELYGLSELLKWALHISYIARDLQIDDRSCLRLETDSAAAKGFCTSVVAWNAMEPLIPEDLKQGLISPILVSFWPPAALYVVPVFPVCTVAYVGKASTGHTLSPAPESTHTFLKDASVSAWTGTDSPSFAASVGSCPQFGKRASLLFWSLQLPFSSWAGG